MFNCRHLEACVFSYLASELKTGDIAVKGADSYSNFLSQLMTAQEIESLIDRCCLEAGLPTSAKAFRQLIEGRLKTTSVDVDAGYPDNADLVIDSETGWPVLKRRKGKESAASAVELERLVPPAAPGGVAAGHRDPGGALGAVVAAVRAAVGLRPQAEGAASPLQRGHLHLRHQHGPGPDVAAPARRGVAA